MLQSTVRFVYCHHTITEIYCNNELYEFPDQSSEDNAKPARDNAAKLETWSHLFQWDQLVIHLDSGAAFYSQLYS